MTKTKVAVLQTSPQSIIRDYQKLMHLAEYQKFISKNSATLIKLNLSWTKYFPACSSQPWQLEGILKTLHDDGFEKKNLFPVENKTVVTNPEKGAKNNKWSPLFKKYGVTYYPLPEVEWIVYQFKEKLLRLDQIFPQGIEIPKMFLGKNVIHLPTVKTHGHSTTTGAVKNAFGGLLKEVRHFAHKYIHEVLVDLMIMQKEIHPEVFCVMDGTVCGNGAGPRLMKPEIKNIILASRDSVAIDAVAASIMGFSPGDIPYIRMCHERGLGTGDLKEIEVLGEDISRFNFNFRTKRSFVIWGDQMIRLGFLRPFEKLLLRSPLFFWAPLASNIYHDFLWYPTIGKKRIKAFSQTDWGKLWKQY